MERLELARRGQRLDVVVRVEEVLGLPEGQVQVDLALRREEVGGDGPLQVLVHGGLHLVVVEQGLFAHGDGSRHADLPLDLLGDERLVFRAVVLHAAGGLA